MSSRDEQLTKAMEKKERATFSGGLDYIRDSLGKNDREEPSRCISLIDQ